MHKSEIFLSGNTKINRVLLRGDHGDESSLTEDLVRKQSSLFISSLSHNTGYFLAVSLFIDFKHLSISFSLVSILRVPQSDGCGWQYLSYGFLP